jgi:hypothetical protein
MPISLVLAGIDVTSMQGLAGLLVSVVVTVRTTPMSGPSSPCVCRWA